MVVDKGLKRNRIILRRFIYQISWSMECTSNIDARNDDNNSNASNYCPTALLFSMLCILVSFQCYGQREITYHNSPSAVQYGYAVKAVIQLSTSSRERASFRLGVSGGIGGFVGDNWFYPTLNADIMFYHGGLGSSWPGSICNGSNYFDLEAIVSYTVTLGWHNRMKEISSIRPGIRNYPLYYFNNWCLPALQNPFNYSFSWGGNWVAFITRRPIRKNQFVGFLNIHADRGQASYINDGPPFFLPFGDKFDRYHTGGGFLSFHGDDDWLINLVELGYNKFTGYSSSSYEMSNRLGNSYVFYPDVEQNFYNKSNWQLNVANTSRYFGATLELVNYRRLDMQHRIHTKSFYPFHLVPYEGFTSGGIIGYYQNVHIGLQ